MENVGNQATYFHLSNFDPKTVEQLIAEGKVPKDTLMKQDAWMPMGAAWEVFRRAGFFGRDLKYTVADDIDEALKPYTITDATGRLYDGMPGNMGYLIWLRGLGVQKGE